MIDVYASRWAEPEKYGSGTIQRMENAVLPITRIRNVGRPGNSRYEGLVHDHKINTPNNREWPQGEVWVGFMKSKNSHLRLPVVAPGYVVEI